MSKTIREWHQCKTKYFFLFFNVCSFALICQKYVITVLVFRINSLLACTVAPWVGKRYYVNSIPLKNNQTKENEYNKTHPFSGTGEIYILWVLCQLLVEVLHQNNPFSVFQSQQTVDLLPQNSSGTESGPARQLSYSKPEHSCTWLGDVTFKFKGLDLQIHPNAL